MDWRRRLQQVLNGSNQLAIVALVAVLVGWHAYGGHFPPTVDALLLTALAGALLVDSLPGSGTASGN